MEHLPTKGWVQPHLMAWWDRVRYAYYAVWGIQCAVCRVKCAVCNFQRAVCCVQCAVYYLLCAVCTEGFQMDAHYEVGLPTACAGFNSCEDVKSKKTELPLWFIWAATFAAWMHTWNLLLSIENCFQLVLRSKKYFFIHQVLLYDKKPRSYYF